MTPEPAGKPPGRGSIGWGVAMLIAAVSTFFCGTFNLCFERFEGFIPQTAQLRLMGGWSIWGWTVLFYAISLVLSVLGCAVMSARMKSRLESPGLCVVILSLDACIALASMLVLLLWLVRISPLAP